MPTSGWMVGVQREVGVAPPPVVSPLLPLCQRPGSSEPQVGKSWLCCFLFECQTHSPRLLHPISSRVCSGLLRYLWHVAAATVKRHTDVLPLHGGVLYVDICTDSCLYTEGSRNLFGYIMYTPLVGFRHCKSLTQLQIKLLGCSHEAQHQATAKC